MDHVSEVDPIGECMYLMCRERERDGEEGERGGARGGG